jgi:hypothetical protein
MEVLYRLYLGVIFGGWGAALLAGAIADSRVGPEGVRWLTDHAAAALGLALALALAAGLRSGARGGLLAIEPADVQYPLLAPLDRRFVLLGPVVRQIRSFAFFGAVAGLFVANFAFRRLPGSAAEWLACLALFGAAAPALTFAAGLLAAGRRLGIVAGSAVGALLIGWSAVDLLVGVTTSPATLLGLLATLPLHHGAALVLAALGLALGVALVAAAFLSLGGLSLDAARSRAQLAAELRFAATVQDLRTVVLLRRQLAAEGPRRRPWARLSTAVRSRSPVWRRDWQSFLRWPASRVLRLVVLGLAAGVAAAGTWSGTTALALVPGLLLLVAAVDAIEPLAQEADHPTRAALAPVPTAKLIRRHVPASVALIALAALLGLVGAIACGWSGPGALAGALTVVPVALIVVSMAALGATNDPYAFLTIPQLGYAQTLAPPAVAVLGAAAPILIARQLARHGHSTAAAVLGLDLFLVAIALAATWYLGIRVSKRVELG